eukprot:scaffold333_cov133-Cylindrotheca_fusiformis.AAC.18
MWRARLACQHNCQSFDYSLHNLVYRATREQITLERAVDFEHNISSPHFTPRFLLTAVDCWRIHRGFFSVNGI